MLPKLTPQTSEGSSTATGCASPSCFRSPCPKSASWRVSISVQVELTLAYTIFIAENLRAFILAVTDCKTDISTSTLIFAQLLLFLPLAMIRNLAKLSGTALVADAFILVGLVYIASCEVGTIVQKGVAPDVVLFNHDNFPLLIGTAVFAFEGIGLYVFCEEGTDRSVIPITETMKDPQKFPRALSGVMIFVAVLFSAFGILGYAAYGSEVQTVVLVNLPQDEKFVQGSQFLCTSPLLSLIDAQTPSLSSSRSLSSSSRPSVSWRRASSPAAASTIAVSSGRRTCSAPGRFSSARSSRGRARLSWTSLFLWLALSHGE